MPTIGQDCDVILFHNNVDGGAYHGYLLDKSRLYRGNISVFRTAYRQADGTFKDHQLVSFTLLMGDGLVNPNGNQNVNSMSAAYQQLFALVNQRSEIGVITADGVFSGMYSSGNYAMEDRAGGVIRLTLQLSSDGNIFAPADRDRFEQSRWVEDTESTGAMTWETSYWRA